MTLDEVIHEELDVLMEGIAGLVAERDALREKVRVLQAERDACMELRRADADYVLNHAKNIIAATKEGT